LVFTDFIAARLAATLDHRAGYRVHQLLPEPVSRLPVDWRKEIRSAAEIAGYNAIGHETSDSFR
jgi:hypothetical protein